VRSAAPGGAALVNPEVNTMASARRKSAGGRAKSAKGSAKAKSHAKAKPAAKKAKRPAKAKPAKGRKPAAKAAKTARPKKPAKAAKPARSAKAAKPVKAAKAAKAAKPVKAAPKPKAVAKPAPRVIGKPAVKGPAKAAPPAPPVRTGPPRLVPATAEARARSVKPPTGRSKLVSRTPSEVRPLGVLPPESMAKPRHVSSRPGVPNSRPLPSAPQRPTTPLKGDDRLSPDDMKYFESRLLAERARIMREMGHLENTVLKVNPRDSAGELSGYSFHMADAGTDSMEREKAFDIASKEGRLLLEIDDALRRLYGGTYGLCESSGKPISRARLEALPWARLSLEEQEKLEREQRAGRVAPGAE